MIASLDFPIAEETFAAGVGVGAVIAMVIMWWRG